MGFPETIPSVRRPRNADGRDSGSPGMEMRRLLHAALILAVAAVIPATALGELCGGSAMSCCSRLDGSASALTRPGCCTAPCIEAAPERQEAGSETRPTRLDVPESSAAGAIRSAVAAQPPVRAAADPASSPPLSRRLASLATLLI
jgi:hypothetical protein